MKSLLLGLAVFVGVSFVATSAEAKPPQAEVIVVAPAQPPAQAKHQGKKGKHQHHEQKQLKQAVKDGRITQQEAKRLKQQKHQLHKMKQAAAADGVITPREQRKLGKAKQSFKQNKQRAIHNQNVR
jgi:hypothetical protein